MEKTNNDTKEDAVFGFFMEISIIENLARVGMEKVLPGGMKSAHFGVLNHLVRLGKSETPAQLASAFRVARPSMTNTLQRLLAKKYISVDPDPKDRRSKFIHITESGRYAHAQAITALGQHFGELVNDLGEQTFAEQLPALQKIRAYMDAK